MGRPKKVVDEDFFADLDGNFKVLVENGSVDDIKRVAADVCFAEQENIKSKKEDLQLQEAKAAFDDAGAQYKETTKANRLKLAYARYVLEGRGKL